MLKSVKKIKKPLLVSASILMLSSMLLGNIDNNAQAATTTTKEYITNLDAVDGSEAGAQTSVGNTTDSGSGIYITTNTVKSASGKNYIGFLYKTSANKKLYNVKGKAIQTVNKNQYIYVVNDTLDARTAGGATVGTLKNMKNLERVYNTISPADLAVKYDASGTIENTFSVTSLTNRLNVYRKAKGKSNISTNTRLSFNLALSLEYEGRVGKDKIRIKDALVGTIYDTWGDVYTNASTEKKIEDNLLVSRFVTRKNLTEVGIIEKFLSRSDVQNFLKSENNALYSFSVRPVLATDNIGNPTTSYEYTLVVFSHK